MKTNSKIINIFILIAFITIAVFGVAGLTLDHHHEPGCPFMPGEQAICPMGLLEHISSWKNIFTVLIPSIFLLLISGVVSTILKNFSLLTPPLALQRLKLNYFQYTPNLYQELFSQGILNPKAP